MTIIHGYCTEAQLKDELGAQGSTDTAKSERAIEAASRQIDGHCDRWFYQTELEARVFEADCGIVTGFDIATITGLVIKTDTADNGLYSTTLTAADYQLAPFNATLDGKPYTQLTAMPGVLFPRYTRPGVQITARFGWPTVPADVVEACLIQAATLIKAASSPFGIVQAGGYDGAGMRATSKLHPTAAALVAPYVRVYV